MKVCRILLAFVLMLLMVSLAHARVEFEVSPGAGYLTGDNTYEIGNVPAELDPWGRDPYFPISRLEFLLGVPIATLDARVTVNRWTLSGGARINIRDRAGNTRDSDWGMPFWDNDGDGGPGWYVWEITDNTHSRYALDVESKSESTVDVLFWEAKVAYELFSSPYRDTFEGPIQGIVRGYFGVGYESRSFEYECALIRQWSPSGIPGYSVIGNGTAGLAYDVSYSIPYAEFTLEGDTGNMGMSFSAGYSPYVRARDEDVHLARRPGPIHAEGKCTGNALKARANLRYAITPHWSVGVLLDYLYLRTSGEQDNAIYAGTNGVTSWDNAFWTTDEKIISRQAYFTLDVRYCFSIHR
ncbi:MAG: omptin family outer membrane protease [Deltaproteobacteria bacterium]|nr:omptin family outer membrane protease [Deltaproteobacteria bacterium]HPW69267.1 omptin family outer membrane protease [Deltaproteobacteria bacterium]